MFGNLLAEFESNVINKYISSQRLKDILLDKESRPLIQAQIVADIMDGYFWVRGHTRGNRVGLVGSKALSSMVQASFICDGYSLAMASHKRN